MQDEDSELCAILVVCYKIYENQISTLFANALVSDKGV